MEDGAIPHCGRVMRMRELNPIALTRGSSAQQVMSWSDTNIKVTVRTAPVSQSGQSGRPVIAFVRSHFAHFGEEHCLRGTSCGPAKQALQFPFSPECKAMATKTSRRQPERIPIGPTRMAFTRTPCAFLCRACATKSAVPSQYRRETPWGGGFFPRPQLNICPCRIVKDSLTGTGRGPRSACVPDGGELNSETINFWRI